MSDPVPVEAQFYTTTQVATLFAVSQETVRDWIEKGTLEAIQIHGRYRIRVDSVKKLADAKYGS